MLADKVVLITGASSGIGRACAEHFSAAGARVVLCARRVDRLRDIAARLPGDAYLLPVDVADRAAVADGIATLPPEWRAVDVLVNAAGVALALAAIHEADPAAIDQIIDTNLKGTIWVTSAVVPGMLARGAGHIVNIGSIASEQVYRGGSVYSATKAAVASITQGLRVDLLGKGITVSSVDPGLTKTEIILNRLDGDEEAHERYYEGMEPLTSDDIAEAVLWTADRPARVQVAEVVMLPRDQASFFYIHRDASQ